MLPRNFSAPLFWSDEEVEELKGSQVTIGRGFRAWDSGSLGFRAIGRGFRAWDSGS